jgi:hypothetical protein
VIGEGEAAHGWQGRHHANTWPWPWHVARTPTPSSFAIAADLNACCSNFLPHGEWRRQGEGHFIDVGSVADRGGAVMLREMGRGGEELWMHGLQNFIGAGWEKRRGEGSGIRPLMVSPANPRWCLLRNHSLEKS